MGEVAYFDVWPDSDSARFNGAWSTYPFFNSGTVIISSIEGGLFVVKPTVDPGETTSQVPSATPTVDLGETTSQAPSATPECDNFQCAIIDLVEALQGILCPFIDCTILDSLIPFLEGLFLY